jgi:hypothetical protein
VISLFPALRCAAFLCLVFQAAAKTPVAVLGAYVEGRDSAFDAGLAEDISQALSEDTALLVYDLRKQNAGYLDSAHAAGRLREPALLAGMSGKRIARGLLLECREAVEEFRCALEALDMLSRGPAYADTLDILPGAAGRRKAFGQAAASGFARRLRAASGDSAAGPGPMAALKLRTPARPAMLIRGMAIIRKGTIAEIPLGATLVILDAPAPVAASIENLHYLLYPHSSYTYILPKVVQLNDGALGILKGADSASLEGRLHAATALDGSNPIWRTLAKVAALDSSNLLWKGLGQVASLDSHNLILKSLRKAAALDSGNALYQAFGSLAALDSSNLLVRTLAQVAALDTSNLVWKGLGQVASLDSTNLIWRKLGDLAALDSNGIWSKLGLLAFQDQSVLLTPSCIVRGRPQAVLLRHEGDLTTLEVVKGELAVQPLLGSQPPVGAGPMQAARTRGYAVKRTRLNPMRGDRLLREFEALDPGRNGRSFAFLLPGRLFGAGAALRTPDRSAQSFISGEFRELDMEIGVLSAEKEGWTDFPGGLRTGAQESGCYLCSPDRLGP